MPDTAPAIGEEVSLTPEQQAQYEQLSQPRPNEVDPIRDFNSQQLAELSVKDPSFNVVEAFRQHPDRSPATVQKVADAFDTVTKRGFKLADLPNPITAVPKAVYEFGKGALKQAWNYANAAGAAVAGAAYGGEAENEMLKDAQQRVAENFSGTEQAVTGLSNQIQGAGRKAVNLVTGGAKTPEDRVKNLWDAVGRGEVSEDISKGHGAFMSAAGGNVIKELETAGKPVRPEEVNTLAAGDPFTFWAFGKALQGAGKVGSAVAEKIPGVQAITSALPEVVAKAGGKVIQAAGSTTEGAGKVAAVTGGLVKTAGPILEAAHGLISGDFTRAAAGGLGEYYGGSALRWLGQQAPKVAKGVKDFGKQVGGEAAITSDYAQAGRDVLQALPGAAGEVAKGAAIDLGVAAVSSETPEQTQNALGMGTAFGALGGAGRTIGHVVSGQIIAPRVWGSNTPVASSGNFPALNAAHSKAYASATRGVQTRINAVRQFVKTAAPGTDVFLSSDPAVLEKSLIDSGVNPQTAKTWSAQEGFFTTDLPGKDGQPHRVVVVTNPDAAPHEAFHAFQDVLGEEGNRAIDEIVKKDYGDRWEEEGQRYASRLGVTGADWRSGLLDLTGWGRSEAIDKLTTSLENQMVSEGHTADPEFVKQRVEGEWNKLREQAKANNPTATPAGIEAAIWRDVLSPDEAKDTADRYIAREIAAENFDAIFKAQGPELAESTSLIGQLARVVSRAMSALGVNPLADRQTEIGRIEPKAATVKAVRNAAVESKPVTPTGAKPEVSAPSMPPKAEQESQKIREWTAKNPITVPDRAKAAGTLADAIDSEQTVQVIYWGAKGEQGGSIESERPERRSEIEAQRDADNKDRPLVRKTFFPERVENTSKGPQIIGWSPDNFYSNANKLAAWIDKVGDSARQKFPYKTDGNGRFTEAGWKELQADLNTFMQNQRAGATGAGETLVVPKETLARGFTQPEKEGATAKLDQDRADVMNYLFGTKIPESAGRVAPLHIAGQEISEATQPSRMQLPVRPRGEYAEQQLEKAGIAGPRGVREINPLRNWIEQAAKSTGVEMPSLIEVSQRLNLNRIADATIAPEVPPVRGNTLTLAAGFQPRPNLSEEPEAIKVAAIRAPSGKIYEADNYRYPTHGGALAKAREAGEDIVSRRGTPGVTEGFVTNAGEFLSRKEAFKRAKEYGQIAGEEFMPRPGELESVGFERSAHGQFQPPATEDIERMTPDEFMKWAQGTGGFTGVAYEAGKRAFEAGPEEVARLRDAYDRMQEKAKALIKTDVQAALTTSSKGQYFREAWEAATGLGSGGEMLRKLNAQAQPRRKEQDIRAGWLDLNGKFHGPGDHEPIARGLLTPEEDRKYPGDGGATQALLARGWVRVEPVIRPVPSRYANYKKPLTRAQKQVLEDWAAANQGQVLSDLGYDARGDVPIYDFSKPGNSGQFQPAAEEKKLPEGIDTGGKKPDNTGVLKNNVEEIRTVAEDYAKAAGINYAPVRRFEQVPEDLARRLADHYESAKSDPTNAEVQKSYSALADETVRQFHAIENAGYRIEPFTGTGEPYKSSAEMVKDVRENKHLFYLPTAEAGELQKGNPMLADSGIEINGDRLPINDVFRAVHDFFGHAKEGYQFGPRGEFNAWREHSEMYSPDAQGALAAETLAQNFWVNYGKHLRDSSGKIPAKGEPGHVTPAERPFAQQKNVVIPDKFITEAKGSSFKQSAQFLPKTATEEDFKLPRGGASGFKKAWILPNGVPVQLGGKWHTQWLDEHRADLEKDYGITDLPKFEGGDTEVAREKALQAGFARINYAQNSGKVTVEARAQDWRNLKESVRQFAISNLDDIDNMGVHLLDSQAKNVVDSKTAQLFHYDTDAEKLAHLPLPEAGEAPSMESASDRLFQRAVSQANKSQFQPKEEQETLTGIGGREALTNPQIAAMTKDELAAHFPEAIIPHRRDESLPSEITKSPLYKQAGSEAEAVKAFGDKLAEFYNSVKDDPATKAGEEWYSDFVPRLKKEFGKDAPLMAELLAATSPQTNVEVNFGYAFDALQGIKSGRFDKIIAKFNQGLEMITDDRWLSWYNRELNAGRIPDAPQEPTPAAFLEHWIFTHDLKPKQSNGKLYGQHSLPVLQVFARRWMDLNAGPKTRNFVANLLGTGHEATIDLWADRTMRRLGYEGHKERWRILPQNVHPVSDADFAFSQLAFRAAAEQVGIKPDAMQGALWFAEKRLWADRGWSRLDLGDFRKEMEKIPLLRRGIEQRLAKSTAQAKIKPAAEGELFSQPVVESRR